MSRNQTKRMAPRSRTLNLVSLLAMMSMINPAKTRSQPRRSGHGGTTYGGGGHGVWGGEAVYTPQHKKMKGYQKNHKGEKILNH